MKYSIGIDIGTTTVKCILFGEGVQVVAEAGREYKTLLPKASWAQQNPEDWWKGVAESIRSILTESRIAPEDIKVISVSTGSSSYDKRRRAAARCVDLDGSEKHQRIRNIRREDRYEEGV